MTSWAWKTDNDWNWKQVPLKEAVLWFEDSSNRLIKKDWVGDYLIMTMAIGVREKRIETTAQKKEWLTWSVTSSMNAEELEEAMQNHSSLMEFYKNATD
jgi:hypothetical protein